VGSESEGVHNQPNKTRNAALMVDENVFKLKI
jgi:hypothetical protein